MHLHFTYSESTFSYFEATRAYLKRYGKPLAFYSDMDEDPELIFTWRATSPNVSA